MIDSLNVLWLLYCFVKWLFCWMFGGYFIVLWNDSIEDFWGLFYKDVLVTLLFTWNDCVVECLLTLLFPEMIASLNVWWLYCYVKWFFCQMFWLLYCYVRWLCMLNVLLLYCFVKVLFCQIICYFIDFWIDCFVECLVTLLLCDIIASLNVWWPYCYVKWFFC